MSTPFWTDSEHLLTCLSLPLQGYRGGVLRQHGVFVTETHDEMQRHKVRHVFPPCQNGGTCNGSTLLPRLPRPWRLRGLAREEGAIYMLLIGRRLAIALVLTALLASPSHAMEVKGSEAAQSVLARMVDWLSSLWANETEAASPAGPSEPTTTPQDAACFPGCDRGMGVDPNG